MPVHTKPLPVCKAILICQRVVPDGAGNVNIMGVRNRFRLAAFPGEIGPMSVFVELVGGVGRYRMKIVFSELQDESEVGFVTGQDFVCSGDRVVAAATVISVPPLPLRHAGAYDVVVLADEQELGRQRFEALLIK